MLRRPINDSLGHETGDAMLRLVASRLRELTRNTDILSRVGGDEFVLILPDVEDSTRVDATAARLVEELSRPYPLHGKLLHVTPSIGGSIFPLHGRDRKTLLSRADAAMYHAKSMGRRCYQMFSPNVQQTSAYRLQLQNDLHLAVACNELFLEYQPRIDLQTGQVRGNEALVRWNHPKHGLISPMEFIPIAEENGLMESIGEWILREACKQQVTWLEKGMPETLMAVNLSVQQISRAGLNHTIRQILGTTRMPAHLLEIEITETMLLHGSTEIVDALRELHQSGVRISIDDFGMGYSSLVYLKRFPLDTLKIDQTFVRDITTDPDDAIIVETIIGLAKNLRKRVIAEGVGDLGPTPPIGTVPRPGATSLRGITAPRSIRLTALGVLDRNRWEISDWRIPLLFGHRQNVRPSYKKSLDASSHSTCSGPNSGGGFREATTEGLNLLQSFDPI